MIFRVRGELGVKVAIMDVSDAPATPEWSLPVAGGHGND